MTTRPPRITIVTPALNAEATIERTIRSVLDQGYGDLEHLVIDGGSTDGTLDIVERFDHVRVISEPDEGLSDALNKGLCRASGDLIGWLNADDLYLPGALDAVAAAFVADPDVAWITGHCRIIDGDDQEIRRPVTAYKTFLLRKYSFLSLLVQNFISAPATFVTPALIERIGLARLDQRYSMDYDLWLRAGRDRPPIVIDRELAAFRMAGNTLSLTGFERQFAEHAAIARSHAQARTPESAAASVNNFLSRLIVLIYRVMQRRAG